MFNYSYFEICCYIDDEPVYIKKHMMTEFEDLKKLGVSNVEDVKYTAITFHDETYYIRKCSDHLIPKLIEKLKK